jgi:hypothetical protein
MYINLTQIRKCPDYVMWVTVHKYHTVSEGVPRSWDKVTTTKCSADPSISNNNSNSNGGGGGGGGGRTKYKVLVYPLL